LLKSWRLKRNKKGLLFTYDTPRRKLVNYLQENESITLSRFSKIAHIRRFVAENILAEFLSMGCISIELNQKPVVYSLDTSFDIETLG
jgi:hypothetical protein